MCMKSATYLAKIRFFAQLTAGFSNGVRGGEFLCHRCFGCQGCLGGVRIASVPVSVREKRCRLVGIRVFPPVRPFVLFFVGNASGLILSRPACFRRVPRNVFYVPTESIPGGDRKHSVDRQNLSESWWDVFFIVREIGIVS